MRFAQDLIDIGFACGAMYYGKSCPWRTADDKMVLHATLATGEKVPFVVDTGAPWSILDPEYVEVLGNHLDCVERMSRESGSRIEVGGWAYEGWLCKMPIALEPEIDSMAGPEMERLELDVTVFVPDCDEWKNPNFLGLNTFLDCIRYAVDPEENAFYFGKD